MGDQFGNAAAFAMSAFEKSARPLLADYCRIFRNDVVLVKCDENARSGPMQTGGQIG